MSGKRLQVKRLDYEEQKPCVVCKREKALSVLNADDVCVICAQSQQLSLFTNIQPGRKPHWRDREVYWIKCESCGKKVDSRVEPYACGQCYDCWAPGNRATLMEISRRNQNHGTRS